MATVFEWLLRTLGILQCILYGRPPMLNLAHSDCRFPRDLEPHVLSDGSTELGCEHSPSLQPIVFRSISFFFFHLVHAWKFHYSAACLSVSIQRTFSVRRESYSSILELDKRIRSFPIPSHLRSPVFGFEGRDWDPIPSRALQQFFVPCDRESSE